MSKILVVSDLHLADGSNKDDFEKKTNNLGREQHLIDFIESQNPSQIILCGDILELWQSKKKNIYEAHPVILNFIDKDPRVVKIIGNHDFTLGGVQKITLTTANGKKICITHGFQCEKRLKNKIESFFNWIIGQIERIFPNVDNFFAHKYYLNQGIRERVEKYAKSILDKGFDIVVCGHSHHHSIENYNSKIYANAGSCQEGLKQGIIIDLDDGTVSMVNQP